ncbi:MAG: bifunctional riboflavin kinase/FAD synthetase [Clostridia bacterium]|nr:bifunctional riboflavin kinase/FAD synthetase [Clostridia bacterium]
MISLSFEKEITAPICLALGFFDSVHLGHRKLLEKTTAYSAAHKAFSCVFTFDNDMGAFFDKDSKQIFTFNERMEIFEKLGLDIVLYKSFDKIFMNKSAEEFLSELFSSRNIVKIFCGYDYSFGRGGKGNVSLLEKFCKDKGVEVEVISKIEQDGERVSTTLIKELLFQGDLEKANKLLKEPFWTQGAVVHGRNVGHLYGIPTANIEYPKGKILPKHGVYGTIVYIDSTKYKGVTNIGTKPTFDESSISVETFIDGTINDIYGKELKIVFVKYLRDIQKFDSPAALSAQIHRDLNWRY